MNDAQEHIAGFMVFFLEIVLDRSIEGLLPAVEMGTDHPTRLGDGQAVVVFWKEGADSPFGGSSTAPGSTAVFERQVDDQILTFQAVEGGFQDQETLSAWTIFGEAIEGPLAGSQLRQLTRP